MSTKYVRKCITIREDQIGFIESQSLNLSNFIQRKLDERKRSLTVGEINGKEN